MNVSERSQFLQRRIDFDANFLRSLVNRGGMRIVPE